MFYFNFELITTIKPFLFLDFDVALGSTTSQLDYFDKTERNAPYKILTTFLLGSD